MKKIYEQNIIKKTYHKPVIEEVILDKEMSLVMASPPPGDPWDTSSFQEDSKENLFPEKPAYDSNESPFGGSRPAW